LRATRQQQSDYFSIPFVSSDEQGPHTLIGSRIYIGMVCDEKASDVRVIVEG
jgi:hypothetical protein